VNRAKVLIPAVLAVAAIAAFYFLVLAPKRDEITRLDTEISSAESAAQQAEAQVGTYLKAKDSYKANYTTVARLGKAVPADDDVRSLLVQLENTSDASKVSFRSLTVTPGSAPTGGTATKTADSLAPAPGSVPVGSAGFAAMPLNFTFDGSFFRLSDFFSRLERYVSVKGDAIDVKGRLLLVGSIAVSPDGTAGLSKLRAQIGAATYLVPQAEGLTGGATPQAPVGATPAATPPAGDGGTVPNTTATLTGAR
jgi:hypothetical protein